MLRIVVFIALMFAAASAAAQSTFDGLRDMMYAGDVDGLEAAFAQDHALSLEGELAFDELRRRVTAVATTHPDFYDTVDAWLDAYPDSPYALTVRSWQYIYAGWGVRGEGPARRISRDALALFNEYMWAETETALAAFETAPDYVGASDAVFALQPITKPLSRWAYRAAVAKVMVVTPNHGSLRKAARAAQPGWGGRGLADVMYLCETFQDYLDDPDYTLDVCRVHLGHDIGLSQRELDQLWNGVDGDAHPVLASAWARYAVDVDYFPGEFSTAQQIVEDYLRGQGQKDVDVAGRYYVRFPAAHEHPEILDGVEAEAIAAAQKAIIHDPFNLVLLRVLLREELFLNRGQNGADAFRYSDNALIMKQRIAVASPFRAYNWFRVARHYEWTGQDRFEDVIDAYYHNGIYYGNHNRELLREYLMHKVDLYNLATDDTAEGQQFTVSPEVITERAICPIVRLDRLLSHGCIGTDSADLACSRFAYNQTLYEEVITRVEDEGLCEADRTTHVSRLKYEPQEVMLQEVMRPLVFD
ncbi:MAG: DUF4034 domain-containing protein [Pseudomonadota bacterium]